MVGRHYGAKMNTRRGFLLFAANDANVYDDLTKQTARRGGVSLPEAHPRKTQVTPAGSASRSEFLRKCVGCWKCLSACPRGLLRPSDSPGHLSRPALDFRRGWCYPECSLCAAACPTGALGKGLLPELKLKTKAGVAEVNRKACLGASGVKCNACMRHCPVKAISQAADGAPVVDAEKCIGCGACEHHCPARPLTAIHVEGLR